LLDFHDCIHRLQVVHEDVLIWLFYFSLEGISRDWYRSLPIASIRSLADFHAAFHVFCKENVPAETLYHKCCHEFNLLNEEQNIHEYFTAVEYISHYDQDIDGLQDVNHYIDTFVIIPNAFTVLGCHEDQIFPLKIQSMINRLIYQQMTFSNLLQILWIAFKFRIGRQREIAVDIRRKIMS
jgi:hypothetical protein